MNLRLVDPSQYENRMKKFDYDMTVVGFGESLSPGNEQREFWGSQSAEEEGGANVLGIQSKAVDALINQIVNAPDRATLVTRIHALDRMLSWGHYLIPNWHLSHFRVASWDKFARPKISPPYSLPLDTWWIDPSRAQDVEAKKPQVQQK
jgi:microcin C transport system substrate-binding protein